MSFGFENGDLTESGSFYRYPDGRIKFVGRKEKGDLIEVKSNGIKATVDKDTWSGTATFDEKNRVFQATAKRSFKHADSKRALKLGQMHNWDTRFLVKDGRKTVAYGKSKPLEIPLKQKKVESVDKVETPKLNGEPRKKKDTNTKVKVVVQPTETSGAVPAFGLAISTITAAALYLI